MALTDKLTAIGNAIRSKTGGNAQLSLTDMATAIAGITPPLKGQFQSKAVNITARSGYTGQFTVNFGDINHIANVYRNWILFFPVAIDSSTYDIGIASNAPIFGGTLLWKDTTNGVAHYYKTVLLSETYNKNTLDLSSSLYSTNAWVYNNSNIEWAPNGNTGIYLKNITSGNYPKVINSTYGWLVYFEPDTT